MGGKSQLSCIMTWYFDNRLCKYFHRIFGSLNCLGLHPGMCMTAASFQSRVYILYTHVFFFHSETDLWFATFLFYFPKSLLHTTRVSRLRYYFISDCRCLMEWCDAHGGWSCCGTECAVQLENAHVYWLSHYGRWAYWCILCHQCLAFNINAR